MAKDSAKNLNSLLEQVSQLREAVYQEGTELFQKWEKDIDRKEFLLSARDLAYYLALRRRDIRNIQMELTPLGLSSLGRLESRTLNNLDAVLTSLSIIAGKESEWSYPSYESFIAGQEQLTKNTRQLFGNKPESRHTRIMVTMPSEAAKDDQLIQLLIRNGMNVARINCAHDDAEIWKEMVGRIRKIAENEQADVKVLMDIAGPKIRTGWVFTTLKKPKVKPGDKWYLAKNWEDLPHKNETKVTAGCSISEIFKTLEVGDQVLYDDGTIESEVEEVTDGGSVLRVKKTRTGKSVRIKAEKGLNFPKSQFDLEMLTEQDKKDMGFAIEYADIMGLSFVKDAEDIKKVQTELISQTDIKRATEIPLMAKIETIQAVENLPAIIMTAAGKNPFSVMIARGDLAVEIGYSRLAELQQEIMWICEAADIPVVWGTEVLDNMISSGIPTRAEVTDAAEGDRAECVMLNKGDYLTDGVAFLSEILKKMQEHQYKKTSRLRALNIAKDK
ncbi:MAG: pyruvate kinase [Alkalibacterium sp.]